VAKEAEVASGVQEAKVFDFSEATIIDVSGAV